MAALGFSGRNERPADLVFLTAGLAMACLLIPDSLQSAELQRLHGHMPAAVAGLKPAGELPKTQRMDLVLGLPLRNQAALSDLLRNLYDPSSRDYRKFLTPEQFTERFGPTESDYFAVMAFAKANGLTLVRTHRNRALLNVSGTVADIQRAFHLALRVYHHPSEARTFYAPDAEPSVALDVALLTVGGLNNYRLPRPMNLRAASGAKAPGAHPLSGSGPGGNYMGNDFRAAYVPGVSLTGVGQTVGLLEFDGYFASDIAAYVSQAGLPSVPLTNVLVDGYGGGAGQNSGEVSLDIEMVISMAPGLSAVIIYEGSTFAATGNDVLNEMANPSQGQPLSLQLSSSWTFPTDASTGQIFRQYAAQGQSYFNASGDSDAYASGANVPTPAGDTNITVVGGTTLTTSGPGGSWQSETAWQWGSDVGSGGGVTSFGMPAWQLGIDMSASHGSPTQRNIPDVALTADNIWVIYGGGQSGGFGGTSCAAPLWAAYTALVNQLASSFGKPPAGFINPAIYALAKGPSYTSCFHDITTGNNTNSSSPNLYYAVPGYDLCTGWGTPNGGNLIYALASDALFITPAAGFDSVGYLGGPFSVTNRTFTLTNLSAAPLTWALTNTAPWLNVSSAGGVLTPGGPSVSVTVSLTPAATNLPVGNYASTIWFTNFQDSLIQPRQFTLQVQTPPDPLQIIPSAGFNSTGYVGGAFTVDSQTFTLTNISTAPLSWTLGRTSLWLDVSSTAGSLAPRAATTLSIGLSAAATSLPANNYSDAVWFTNLSDGVVQPRVFNLSVLSGELIQNGGFETHDFTGWTKGGDSLAQQGLRVTSNSRYVHSGTNGAALGAQYTLGYISQTVPTTPGQLYRFSFWLASPDGLAPTQFTASWDNVTLFSRSNLPKFPWTNVVFMVTATTSQTLVQLGGQDQPSFLALDDISVAPVVPPRILTVSRAPGTFNLAWSALSGVVYQVQYATNLTQSNWANLAGSITATNSVASASDSSSDPTRFYRVLILH